MAAAARSTGRVKWFSGQKGFGFVSPDAVGDDLFVHQTEIQSDGFRTLRQGQKVEFVVDCREDGRSKAVNVVILSSNHNSGCRGRDRGGGSYGRGGGRFGGGYAGSDGVECYNCGRIGHLARECYRSGGRGGGGGEGDSGYRGYGRHDGGGGGGVDGGGDGGYRGYGRRGSRVRGGRGSGGRKECFNCGEEGHFARDCSIEQC